ncbi:collagen-like protein [Anabaena sphaerica FACHB-251]|uniref:Collagen-like protein n=1 Tax=Anabaena sphaerica FACHB-251 TaxID=2692883 RepID=A0A926WGM9_9NOST|nr:collagen-like protein [Anabaena sphaerica]MBD2293459.1 collagen-like protein [Anabaena sphaerica FACHB-251]
MFKGFGRKLPLLLSFCLFNSFLPAAAVDVCSTETAKGDYKIAERYDRDRDRRYDDRGGDRGSDGRAGRDGRSGQNQTISADGSPVNLDLSGTNGEDGEDGENASRPRCGKDYSEKENRDINASDGGNGGAGGKGGEGGNGGSLTVYYSNLADLKKIFIRAIGGEGGRGGRGGQGTAGCNCPRRSWEVKTCKGTPGTPDHKCTNKVYRCYDGRNGSDGSNGRDGQRGRLGTLSIINSKEPLVDDAPTRKVAISQLINQQFNLSKNKWLQRQGAVSLLAAGSVIADEYREFDRRLEGTFKLIWQEKQPIANFADQNVTLSLNDNQQVEIAFPEDMWVDGSAKIQDKLTEFTVNYAIPQKDVTRLAVSEFAGAGQDLNLKIVDLAGRSDLINTQFKVKYRARDNFSGISDYQTFYEGEIPATLITREYNRFILALGKLKIPSDALSSSTNVEIELVAIRSLGGRSAQQTLRWQGAIRRSK